MIDRLVAALVMAGMAVPAAAGQFEVFSARCLDPFEHLSPPVITGLEPMEEGAGYSAYPLPEGFVLVYETAPQDDAVAACSVLGRYVRGEALLFEIWALDQVEAGRYAEADGRLLSTTWIEPKVAVELFSDADSLTMRVVETDLES